MPRTAPSIENLQQWRNPPVRDASITETIEKTESRITRTHRQIGALGTLWRELVPIELLERTALVSFVRGVLTVETADSAAHHQLDRLLRNGLERSLQRSSRATLRKIRCIAPGRSARA